jgi:hypothetical protein
MKNDIGLDLFALDSEELRLIQTKPFKTKGSPGIAGKLINY